MNRASRVPVIAFLVIVCVMGVVLFQRAAAGDRSTIEEFISEYVATDDLIEQRSIAAHYLGTFSTSELSEAIEVQYPLSLCHTQVHGLGRAVYAHEHSLTSAMQQCGTQCGYGCFHGVIMEMFNSDSDTLGGALNEEIPTTIIEDIGARAKDLCSSPEVRNVVLPAYCSHGVGHVFAIMTGDLDRAVESCSVFAHAVGRNACAGGVFMEYAREARNRDTVVRKSLSVCDPYREHAAQCYLNIAPVVVPSLGGIRNAMTACQQLGESKKYACIFGMAYFALEMNNFASKNGPDWVCGTLDTDKERQSCISGGLHEVINVIVGQGTSVACDSMDPAYRSQCHTIFDKQQEAPEV